MESRDLEYREVYLTGIGEECHRMFRKPDREWLLVFYLQVYAGCSPLTELGVSKGSTGNYVKLSVWGMLVLNNAVNQ